MTVNEVRHLLDIYTVCVNKCVRCNKGFTNVCKICSNDAMWRNIREIDYQSFKLQFD